MSDTLRSLLFTTIFHSDTVVGPQLDTLNRAAEALASTIKNTPKAIPKLALNTFLPHGHPEGLTLARNALEAEWPTFASEKKDGGLPYLRAVSVLALMEHSTDPITGSALFLLLIDPLGRQVEPREAPLREHVLARLRDTYQAESQRAWESVEVNVKDLTVSVPESLTLIDENEAVVQQKLDTAIMASPIGKSYSPNYGQWQDIQNSDTWATAVSTSIAESMSLRITSAFSPVLAALNDHLKGMGNFTPALTEALHAVKLTERRMNVMWWMQSRYSPSLQQAYRALGAWHSTYRMSYDLDDLVPRPAPPVLEAILVEAWDTLFGNSDTDTLTNILKHIATHDSNFTDAQSKSSISPDTILEALKAANTPKLTQKQVTTMTGVAGNTPITGPEFALWVFRTYQALELLK